MKILLVKLFVLLAIFGACVSNDSKTVNNSISGSSSLNNHVNDSLPNNVNGEWGKMIPGVGDGISTFCVYNNQVYVGGTALITDKNQQDEVIALNSMEKLDGGIKDPESIVNTMTVYKGNLIVGGFFDTVGGKPTRGIAKWDGKNWEPLDMNAIKRRKNLGPMALTVYNGDIIAGGKFDSIDGSSLNDISEWDGNNWKPLAGGLKGSSHSLGVIALLANQSDLYAAGSFSYADGQPAANIAKWDGKSWSTLNGGIGNNDGSIVYTLAMYKGELYAGGIFTSIGGEHVNNIAKWNGKSWEQIAGGVSDKNRDENAPAIGVYALKEYNGELYVGGSFGYAGGKQAKNIAKWDGKDWSSVGEYNKLDGEMITAMVVCNNDLFIGGSSRPDPGSAFIIKWSESTKK